MTISERIQAIQSSLPPHVTLVAVSKTQPLAAVREAYDAGQRIFGENRIQEMTEKWEALPKDIEWHMIGHVQSNKVKYMIPYVKLIHGVDSLKLLLEIERLARKWRRTVDVLLQVHIAEEDTKFGLSDAELKEVFASADYSSLTHTNVRGLMGMATFTDDTTQVRREFQHLKTLFDQTKQGLGKADFDILSMGMSGDYTEAVATGSTMVRIGSSIFGERSKP
ncbi:MULTISPECIES: YggS family pyridoxal phosphate-dependent enzyme [unclassified Flavobacterium]|uniref:YggS family pyridoxal phosphate-dependent enzyme n=1 Tax=unclassified Flavobacterium TaxID=196869 RepID=UPI001F12BD2D|nr:MULTISPECIES: YggS family pyridoxal phosphate-dependent enzyme [unclassified Flavobacterium]UMY64423.1 YggS family pyridoxal phosphate-dependent enzyme [Flavobacterium sp. HJ-32-4]